jgi:hypothetical protein
VQRHPQSVEDERGAHVARELPADDLAAVGVDDEAEEHEPLPAAQVGEVREPELVRPGGLELALHEIGAAHRRGIGPGGAPRLSPALCALQGVLAHQTLDPTAPDLLTGSEERLPHPPRAIGEVVALV